MGRIVAIGGTDEGSEESLPIFEKIDSLSKKESGKVTYLPTAHFDNDDGFEDVVEKFKNLGYTDIKSLHLSDETLTKEEIAEQILSSDVVYACGGNLKFMMETWKKADVFGIIKEAFEKNIVLSGTSSGSMCWFERGYDDCGENGAFMFLDCAGLLPYCNCPHYQSENWQSFEKALPAQNITGIAVDNDAALVYEDGKYYVIKTDPESSAYLISEKNGFTRSDISVNGMTE